MTVGSAVSPVETTGEPAGEPSAEKQHPSARHWQRHYVQVVTAADLAAAAVAGLVAYLVRFGYQAGRSTFYVLASALLPVVWWACLHLARAAEPRFLGNGSEEFRRVTAAAFGLTALVGTVSWATKAEVARGYVVLALPLLLVVTLVLRFGTRKYVHRLRSRGRCQMRTVVVGPAAAVDELTSQLRREPYHGLAVVDVFTAPRRQHDVPALDEVTVADDIERILEAVEVSRADVVAVLGSADLDSRRLRRLAWALEALDVELVVAPALLDVAGPRTTIRPACGVPLLHVEHPEVSGVRRRAKGALDRTAAAVGVLALAPFLLAIAALIRLGSPGPAFYRQVRIGQYGRPFTMVKFRTMVRDADQQVEHLKYRNEGGEMLFKIREDPRVTQIGAWLRRHSIDEVPQLFNVVTGAMSLVGPRPPLPEEVQRYGPDAGRRLVVKPGMTGLWQVSGRSDLSWDDSVRLDLRYVESWTLGLDALVLWKTLGVVLRGSGAY